MGGRTGAVRGVAWHVALIVLCSCKNTNLPPTHRNEMKETPTRPPISINPTRTQARRRRGAGALRLPQGPHAPARVFDGARAVRPDERHGAQPGNDRHGKRSYVRVGRSVYVYIKGNPLIVHSAPKLPAFHTPTPSPQRSPRASSRRPAWWRSTRTSGSGTIT